MKKDKSRMLQALRAVRDEIYASVRLQLSDERLTYQQIADANGISLATVQRVAERSGISRPVGPRPRASAVSEGMNTATAEKLNPEHGQRADETSQEACPPDGGE